MMTTEQIGELARHFKIDEASIMREYVQLLFLRSFYALKESRNVFFKDGPEKKHPPKTRVIGNRSWCFSHHP